MLVKPMRERILKNRAATQNRERVLSLSKEVLF